MGLWENSGESCLDLGELQTRLGQCRRHKANPAIDPTAVWGATIDTTVEGPLVDPEAADLSAMPIEEGLVIGGRCRIGKTVGKTRLVGAARALLEHAPVGSCQRIANLSAVTYNSLVRARGLEPPLLAEPDPKSGASAISPRPRWVFGPSPTVWQQATYAASIVGSLCLGLIAKPLGSATKSANRRQILKRGKQGQDLLSTLGGLRAQPSNFRGRWEGGGRGSGTSAGSEGQTNS